MPYQIHTTCTNQCLIYQIIVLRITILQQGSLHCFFVWIPRYIHFFHSARVIATVIHCCCHAARCWDKILYLFRIIPNIANIFSQKHCICQRTARMTRHEIWHQILFFPYFFAIFKITLCKTVIYFTLRFAHIMQSIRRYMFRCYFQQPTNMMFTHFIKEGAVRICHNIVEAYPGTNEYFLHFF